MQRVAAAYPEQMTATRLGLDGAAALPAAGRPRLVSWLLVVSSLPVAVVGGWASALVPGSATMWFFCSGLLVAGISFGAGLLVARHDPGNWVGPVLTSAGAVIVGTSAYDAYALALVERPGSLPRSDLFIVLTQGVWMWLFIPFAMLLLVFPDGRARRPRDRAALLSLPVVFLAFTLLLSVLPGRLAAPLPESPRVLGTHWIGYAAFALLPVFMGLLVVAALSVRGRYRDAGDDRTRAQLKWLSLACASVPATLLLCWLSYLLLDGPDLVALGLVVMYVAIPVATLVAMLRHDLYDVDKALVAGAAYSALAVLVLATYAGVSALLGTMAGGGSTGPAVVATVVAMLALLPLRRLLLGRAGRLLHPVRQRGLVAVDTLLRSVHAGGDRPERLEDDLRVALRDPDLRVGYRLPGDDAVVDRDGAPVPRERATPIRLAGAEIGLLVGGPTRGRPPQDVADAAALLADAVRLRLELSHALDEVEASRTRLVRTGYEERRRLEMDLHDGAQQRLVSLGMSLRLAQRKLQSQRDVDVDVLLDHSVDEIAAAVAELRQLAHGLRPSSLDDGLGVALSNLSRRTSLPVTLAYDADELPDDVSTTAYFVASEAVTNAVKHADAATIDVVVRRQGHDVRIAVCDDGRGGASLRDGSGLAGLRDRVLALGGRLDVSSAPGGGTTIEAVLPCGS